MIIREKYISQIRGFYDSDLIKVITGVRRCGKSVILEQIMKEVGEKTDNIVYLDFEDRFALVEVKRSSLDTVRLAIQNKIGSFTKQDIRELCPSLSLSSVEGALRKLVESGELRREGKGKIRTIIEQNNSCAITNKAAPLIRQMY